MADHPRAYLPMTPTDLQSLQIVPPADLQPPFRFFQLPRGPYTEYWDVVGVREPESPSALLEFRLLHLEQELVEDGWDHEDDPEWPYFDALREAPGFIGVAPEEYLATIAFFASWLTDSSAIAQSERSCFRWLDWDELAPLHVRPIVPGESSSFYLYTPDPGIAARPEEVSLVKAPRWRGQFPPNQHVLLEFMTFERRYLTDPLFNPRDTWGLGSMRLSQPALRASIALLEQHTYEQARLRAQS